MTPPSARPTYLLRTSVRISQPNEHNREVFHADVPLGIPEIMFIRGFMELLKAENLDTSIDEIYRAWVTYSLRSLQQPEGDPPRAEERLYAAAVYLKCQDGFPYFVVVEKGLTSAAIDEYIAQNEFHVGIQPTSPPLLRIELVEIPEQTLPFFVSPIPVPFAIRVRTRGVRTRDDMDDADRAD